MLHFLSEQGIVADIQAFLELKMPYRLLVSIYQAMMTTYLFSRQMYLESARGMGLYISPEGQVASVASAFAMKPQDWIFWYTRAHEIAIARGMSLHELAKIFFGISDADTREELRRISSGMPYILVGSHLTHAEGFAHSCKLEGRDTVVAAYFGDGATSQGDFHSAMNLAAINRSPIIFVCQNNQIAISTPQQEQTATHTYAEKALAYALQGKLVDGNDILAIYASMREAVTRAREGLPTLLEFVMYRTVEHTTAINIDRLRLPEEDNLIKNRIKESAPIHRTYQFICGQAIELLNPLPEEVWTSVKDEQFVSVTAGNIAKIAERIRNEQKGESRRGARALIQRSVDFLSAPIAGVNPPRRFPSVRPEENVFDTISFIEAVQIALHDLLAGTSKSAILGEDVGGIGGVYGANALPAWLVSRWYPQLQHRLLTKKRDDKKLWLPFADIFGRERCRDMPLDEDSIMGSAIGRAMNGELVIVEVQFSGFVFESMNQTELAAYLAQDLGGLPIIVRLPYGGGPYIRHHREFEASRFMGNPGYIIIAPCAPQQAYDAVIAAGYSNKVVLIFEDKNLYNDSRARGVLVRRHPPQPIEEFGARIVRKGTDVTITACGRYVYACCEVADELAHDGISAQVLDVQMLSPIDSKTIFSCIKKTGRIVSVEEEPTFGHSDAIAALILRDRETMLSLKGPALRVGPPRAHFPPHALHDFYLPQKEDIKKKVLEAIESDY